MKISFVKFVTVTFLSAGILATPVALRAADSGTNSTAKAAPGKISGTVGAVDTNAMTFTVDGKTYSETSASILTRNGKPATLAEVAVGDPVQGTCTTGSDGKLEATKVKFGKGAEKSGSKSTAPAKKTSKKKKKAAAAAVTNSVPDTMTPPDAAPAGAAPASSTPPPASPAVPLPPQTSPGH